MIDGLSLQLRLVVVYRPPYSAAHPVTSSTFFPEFSEYLESLVLSKVPICIYGDFILMSVMMRIPLRLRIYWNHCVLLNT